MKCMPLADWKIKRQVQEYFEERDRGYASQVAKTMSLKWADVTTALEELHREGLLDRSECNRCYRRISQ